MGITLRTNFSTSAIRSLVTSIRVPLGARTAISKAPASASGKNSRRMTGSSVTSDERQGAKPTAIVVRGWLRTPSSPLT